MPDKDKEDYPDLGRAVVERIEKILPRPAAPPAPLREIAKVAASAGVTIGTDSATGVAVSLGDTQRCGGLYVLGQPRTGKSNLLASVIDLKPTWRLLRPVIVSIRCLRERPSRSSRPDDQGVAFPQMIYGFLEPYAFCFGA
jgi:hypothetical protein